jgi:hypothetical protein
MVGGGEGGRGQVRDLTPVVSEADQEREHLVLPRGGSDGAA